MPTRMHNKAVDCGPSSALRGLLSKSHGLSSIDYGLKSGQNQLVSTKTPSSVDLELWTNRYRLFPNSKAYFCPHDS
jgi:hypothetical protein